VRSLSSSSFRSTFCSEAHMRSGCWPFPELRAYDVVLTTYGTLVTEFPKPEKKKKKKRAPPVDGIESESDQEDAKPPQKVRLSSCSPHSPSLLRSYADRIFHPSSASCQSIVGTASADRVVSNRLSLPSLLSLFLRRARRLIRVLLPKDSRRSPEHSKPKHSSLDVHLGDGS
jgi:hypothetical protein